VIDTEGTVLAASCWYRLILKDSGSAEGKVMLLGLEFSKGLLFRNLEDKKLRIRGINIKDQNNGVLILKVRLIYSN
jgi:hypothetical protein